MQTLWQDLRYGARMLVKNPGFTLIAALTLSLGIGANTAIFSVVNSVLLRPLPYEEPDQLTLLTEYGAHFGEMSISYPNFTDWRAQNRVFEKIGVYNRENYTLTGSGEPERLRVAQMSADVFAALRVKAALGRVYTNDEDKPGASPVVVLSHGLWQRRFGADASVIGRSITLNDRGYTVIGVMPRGFLFPTRVEMWTPVGPLSDQETWKQRGNHPGLSALARLKPGVTLEQARADMKNITAALEKEYPGSNTGASATIIPLLENYVSDIRQSLYVLFGAVGFVLLIACANVASLTLARASSRQREMAVRAALGAGRWRIVRQLLTESGLLALAGGGLGLLLAQWGVTAILAISPEGAIPRVAEIGLDRSVLLFTAAVSILTGIVFGLAPAMQSSHADVQEALKETGRGATGRRRWLRSGMVMAEIALTLVLLVGAGLMIRSFFRLQQVNPGFATENTLSFAISLPERNYPDTELDKRINFFNQVKEKIAALPGAQSVGLSSGLPLGSNGWQTSFTVAGRPDPPLSQTPSMEACVADVGYFETMRIPLLRGRWFDDRDNRAHLRPEDLKGKSPLQQFLAGLRSIVIDEEFARRYWPNENPIGKQVRLGRSDDPLSTALTVVGVVGRVKMEGLRNNSDRVQGYFPFRQFPFSGMIFTVRTTLVPEQLIASVRRQAQDVDPNQPIYSVRTLEQIRAESIAPERLNLTLLGVFAAVALVLALVGIYGVISWSVTQQTREIGVRMALGAQAGAVLRLVVGRGMKLVGAGIGLGLLGALLLARLMTSLLFGVSAADPITFGFVTLLLAGVALLACLVPARRATKVDPMVVLRSE
ncbi:MAG TPA: ABC transporter permease [Blastocatellia bacterium]|jgi:putative ABC transport system permease protein|nr:ABC transporter permease [Blastocatellia bacterium]